MTHQPNNDSSTSSTSYVDILAYAAMTFFILTLAFQFTSVMTFLTARVWSWAALWAALLLTLVLLSLSLYSPVRQWLARHDGMRYLIVSLLLVELAMSIGLITQASIISGGSAASVQNDAASLAQEKLDRYATKALAAHHPAGFDYLSISSEPTGFELANKPSLICVFQQIYYNPVLIPIGAPAVPTSLPRVKFTLAAVPGKINAWQVVRSNTLDFTIQTVLPQDVTIMINACMDAYASHPIIPLKNQQAWGKL